MGKGVIFNLEDISKILDYDEKKLLNYLNLSHNTILSNLFSKENKENINLKIEFIRENINKSPKEIISLLKNRGIEKKYFDYYENLILLLASHNLDEKNFQIELGKINEKTNIRKQKGVYYTPEDVTDFIIYNSIYKFISSKFKTKYTPLNPKKISMEILKLSKKGNLKKMVDIINKSSVLDPTCGTAAFLVQVLNIKADLIKTIKGDVSSTDIDSIIKNLKGNDLDPFSTYISKTRLLFKSLFFCKNINLEKVMSHLDNNFSTINFISGIFPEEKIDLIVGNPPYVEKSKTPDGKYMKYGNTYADVLHTSLDLLSKEGVLGFIIPLSYISTPRMRSIREFVESNSNEQFVFSYNDRPDCLFSGVHQKLNILLLQKGLNNSCKTHTSDYFYWNRAERKDLFKKPNIVLNTFGIRSCYPKIGEKIEENILKKVMTNNESILDLKNDNEENKIYLNMRATYWIKSFIKKPYELNEYKEFGFSKEHQHFMNCILNSTLYWWFWVKVSDCWHITQKELEGFKIPKINSINTSRFEKLSLKLDSFLDKTKNKINTKQTMYEYKHKLAKHIIDEIDDELSKIYGLNKKEISFIKNYQEKYRLGRK